LQLEKGRLDRATLRAAVTGARGLNSGSVEIGCLRNLIFHRRCERARHDAAVWRDLDNEPLFLYIQSVQK
jgi:hypothetical protein